MKRTKSSFIVKNIETAQFFVNPLKNESTDENNDVSEPPLPSFAKHSNYITSVLLSVTTATVCHYSWPSSELISSLCNCLFAVVKYSKAFQSPFFHTL
jgi:hypothetical protein